MKHKSLNNWKDEHIIIKCLVCGCDVKTTHALRKYCYDCRIAKKRVRKG